VQIEWQTTGRVQRVLIYRDGDLIYESLVDFGVIRDCPPPGRFVYTVDAIGPGGTDSARDTIDTR
jgi:hypothetical protein